MISAFFKDYGRLLKQWWTFLLPLGFLLGGINFILSTGLLALFFGLTVSFIIIICLSIFSMYMMFFLYYLGIQTEQEKNIWALLDDYTSLLKKNWVNFIKFNAYISLDVLNGILLFLIPGIIKMFKYMFAIGSFFENPDRNPIQYSMSIFNKRKKTFIGILLGWFAVWILLSVSQKTLLINYPNISGAFIAALSVFLYPVYGAFYKVSKQEVGQDQDDLSQFEEPYPGWKAIGKKVLFTLLGVSIWIFLAVWLPGVVKSL